jgi:dihydroflavonol-4-reductase
MRALVMGATGFVGGNIVRACLERGWEVRALRRRADAVGAIGDISDMVEWYQGDLSHMDDAMLNEMMRGCDIVFHAAAPYPHAEKNLRHILSYCVMQTRSILAAASRVKVKRFVYTSSFTTVGQSRDLRFADEDDFYVPGTIRSVYYATKFAMEMEVWRASAEGLPAIILNPTIILGPGDVKPATGELLLRIAKRQIWFSFLASVNIVDVRDVALAHASAAEQGRVSQRYIIGGHNMTLREFLEKTASIAGVPQPKVEIPARAIHKILGLAKVLPLTSIDIVQTVRYWQPMNIEKARRELGLDPRPLEATVSDSLKWFREHGYLSYDGTQQRQDEHNRSVPAVAR